MPLVVADESHLRMQRGATKVVRKRGYEVRERLRRDRAHSIVNEEAYGKNVSTIDIAPQRRNRVLGY